MSTTADEDIAKEARRTQWQGTNRNSAARKDAAWAEAMARADEHAGLAQFGSRDSAEHLRRELHEDLDARQLGTYSRWWNSILARHEPPLQVTDLCADDVPPGVVPIRLLELLSNSKVAGPVNAKPFNKYQMMENHNTFLAHLKAQDVHLVNIGAEDLVEGNQKLILGLTWTLILRYEIHKFGGDEKELLRWARRMSVGRGIPVGGWAEGFRDGLAFTAILHQTDPEMIDLEGAKALPPAARLEAAFDVAEAVLGVPKLLEAADLTGDKRPDERSIMTYCAKLKQACDEKMSARARMVAASEAGAHDDALQLSLVEWVNFLRTEPAEAATYLRERLAGCYDGRVFTPPWSRGVVPVESERTVEGEAALSSLLATPDELRPLGAVHEVSALSEASSSLAHEALHLAADRRSSGSVDAAAAHSRSTLHTRLKRRGVWAGVAGEGVVNGATLAEAVALKLALSDGDPKRSNRNFILTPELAVAGVASASCPADADGKKGRSCTVLTLVESFSPLLRRNVVVEQHGLVAHRDRRAGPGGSVPFTEVLNAIPSREARDIVTKHLVKGSRVKIEYEAQPVDTSRDPPPQLDGALLPPLFGAPSGGAEVEGAAPSPGGKVTITITNGKGKKRVTRLRWA